MERRPGPKWPCSPRSACSLHTHPAGRSPCNSHLQAFTLIVPSPCAPSPWESCPAIFQVPLPSSSHSLKEILAKSCTPEGCVSPPPGTRVSREPGLSPVPWPAWSISPSAVELKSSERVASTEDGEGGGVSPLQDQAETDQGRWAPLSGGNRSSKECGVRCCQMTPEKETAHGPLKAQ